MEKEKAPLVPVYAEVPPEYRIRMNCQRQEGGYKNLGQMLMVWIDEKAAEAKAKEA